MSACRMQGVCAVLCVGLVVALQAQQVHRAQVYGHPWVTENCRRLSTLLRHKHSAVRKLGSAALVLERDQTLAPNEKLFRIHTLEVFQRELNESERSLFQAVEGLQRVLTGNFKDIVNMRDSSRQRLQALREAAIKEEQEYMELLAAEKHQQEALKVAQDRNKTLSMLDEILEDVRKAADRLEEDIEEHAFDNNKQSMVQVETLGELGVFFTLFVVGLEFSPERLHKVWRISLQGSGGLSLLMVSAGLLWGKMLHLQPSQTVFISCCLSLSSTPVVSRFLAGGSRAESKEGELDYSSVLLGMLVMQDVQLGLFIAVMPTFIQGGTGDTDSVLMGTLHVLVLLARVLVSLAGVLVMCWILRSHLIGPFYRKLHAESKGNKEILVLGTSAFVFLMLTVTEFMDVSMELGCFLAGALLSSQGHMVTAEVMSCAEPIRDFLAIIFFASIGLHVFPTFVLYELTILLVLTFSLVIMKFLMAVLVLSAALPPGSRHMRWLVSAGLAQVSEFSFVLGSRARRAGIISREVSGVRLLPECPGVSAGPQRHHTQSPLGSGVVESRYEPIYPTTRPENSHLRLSGDAHGKRMHHIDAAGLKETNGEIKLFVNQTLSPGKPAGVLSFLTVHPATISAVKQILPKTLTGAHVLPHVVMGTPQRTVLLPGPRSPNTHFHTPQTQNTHESSPWSTGRSRKGDKSGKGLRHFSMKVCEKVQKKVVTSYNEVADELVTEFSSGDTHISPNEAHVYDQKNIRRRVYDALNVLMAMNIISKDKKEIKWIGFPTNSAQECEDLEVERQRRLERIKHKQSQLQELILQQIAFKNLVQRNSQAERQSQRSPSPNTLIHLPFIIINTSKRTVIDCSISNDKFEYLFNFDSMFEIHDDVEVLKRMGLAFGLESGRCNPEQLKIARTLVPKALQPYLTEMAQGAVNQLIGKLSHVATDRGPSSSNGSRDETPSSHMEDEEEDDEIEDSDEDEDDDDD
ncbi:unnamed protein product [Leuciscus chuanchicus]